MLNLDIGTLCTKQYLVKSYGLEKGELIKNIDDKKGTLKLHKNMFL